MAPGAIEIRWYAVPNAYESRGGWRPAYDVNGRQHGNTYGVGLSKDDALAAAEAAAREEADRYVGEWDIAVDRRVA